MNSDVSTVQQSGNLSVYEIPQVVEQEEKEEQEEEISLTDLFPDPADFVPPSPTFTFPPNLSSSSPPSPLMAGLAHQKTPAPPPSPIVARFGIGGRAVAAAPEFAGHRSVCRSASAAGGLVVGASGSGPTKHPPPSPSSLFKRERMDSAGSISGNNRGSGGDIALRQLDAELGRGFVIITLDMFAPFFMPFHFIQTW